MEETNSASESCPTYSVVNVQHKRKKAAERSMKSENVELYAVVDKTKKRKEPEKVQKHYEEKNKNLELESTNLTTKMSGSPSPKYKSKFRKCKSSGLFTQLGLILLLLLTLAFIISSGVSYAMISSLRSESISNKQTLKAVQSKFELNLNTTLNFSTTFIELLHNTTYDINTTIIDIINQVNKNTDSISSIINPLLGKNQFFPAPSCWILYFFQPSSSSGYYWVTSSNGTSVQVYCEMTKSCGNITGGLTRIALVNDENLPQICTGEFMITGRGCRTNSISCPHLTFPSRNISYSHVCGEVNGDLTFNPDGFTGGSRSSSTTINDNYVDGISLTIGAAPNRTHIWTFIGDERPANPRCPRNVPEFVGDYYSCFNWTGLCTESFSCTHRFFRQLQHPVTENIEMRLCQDDTLQNEEIAFRSVKIYVW